MDIGAIFLFCLFAVFQIYIYLGVGIIAFFKKIFNTKALRYLSQMIINFFLPIQSVIEISRMATMENIIELWILVISVITAILLGFLIGRLYNLIFKIDLRMTNIYAFIISLPSIGTLPLVLGKAFCYPDGPLRDDPKCNNMLGYMMVNALVFTLILYTNGFIIIANDAEFAKEIEQIISFSWHSVCEKIYGNKNYFILAIFSDFMKNEKLAKEKFNEFDKNCKLKKCDDGLKYIFEDHRIDSFKHGMGEGENKHVNFIIRNELKQKEKQIFEKNFQESREKDDQNNQNIVIDLPFIKEVSLKESEDINNYSIDKENEIKSEIDSEFDKKESKINDELNRKSLINNNSEKLNLPEKFNLKTNLELDNILIKNENQHKAKSLKINKLAVHDFYKKDDLDKTMSSFEFLKIQKPYFNINEESQLKNTHHINLNNENETGFFIPSNLKIYLNENQREFELELERKLLEENEKNSKSIAEKKKSSFYISPANATINQVELYYNLIFKEIEENINEKKKSEFNSLKLEIISKLSDVPNKFPIAKGVLINNKNIDKIKQIWNEEYLIWIKKYIPNFELQKYEYSVDKFMILNKLCSPPVVASISGILLGISNLRSIMFSNNHYISNLMEGFLIVSKVSVPFLYISTGISFIANPGFNLNIIVTKFHVALGMVHRFIVMPIIGLGWVYVWTKYYGGILAESKVIRIAIFIPFCVPSGNNIIMLVNVMKYYINETATLMIMQNISMIVTLTLLYVFYFILIGF